MHSKKNIIICKFINLNNKYNFGKKCKFQRNKRHNSQIRRFETREQVAKARIKRNKG